jgi:hypothetical protein
MNNFEILSVKTSNQCPQDLDIVGAIISIDTIEINKKLLNKGEYFEMQLLVTKPNGLEIRAGDIVIKGRITDTVLKQRNGIKNKRLTEQLYVVLFTVFLIATVLAIGIAKYVIIAIAIIIVVLFAINLQADS